VNYQLLNLFDESANFPSSDFNCKFILIENVTSCWLVFGPLSTYRYHAQLVQRFCVINDIGFSWVKKPDLVEVLDGDIEVKGGGIIAFEKDKLLLKFGSHSTAYGKFDNALLDVFIENSTFGKGIRILIGT